MTNYNVDSLRAAIKRHEGNILNFEQAILNERTVIASFQKHIEEALARPPTNIVIDSAEMHADDGNDED